MQFSRFNMLTHKYHKHLSSSNFFMQILNAPTRDEIDRAHKQGHWLEIGVSSIHNLFRVSAFKSCCWVALLVTSIPIHLLFNSVITRTEYKNTDFSLTIAIESFVDDGEYFLPGASLMTLDNASYVEHQNEDLYSQVESGYYATRGWGQWYNLSDYTNATSELSRQIAHVSQNGKKWDNLTFSTCQDQYGLYGTTCGGLETHTNLILIIQEPDGWTRNQMWHLTDHQASVWNPIVPPDEPNTLFFHTNCQMHGAPESLYDDGCEDSCASALGSRFIDDGAGARQITSNWPSGFPFFDGLALNVFNASDDDGALTSGLQPDTFNLSVQYCLAEPSQELCHIAISPALFLAVVLCIVLKLTIALLVTVVLGRCQHPSLVTLGDYVVSLIQRPDAYMAEKSSTILANGPRGAVVLPGHRPWPKSHRWTRRGTIAPLSLWFVTYILLLGTLSIWIFFFAQGTNNDFSFSQYLAGRNHQLNLPEIPSFLAGVLIVNSPQIALSLVYVAINSLLTHILVAAEWATLASHCAPFRVTDPKGKQTSTYRLQLPYRVSVPLLSASALLHWLAANSLFVSISEGAYNAWAQRNDSGLPPNTASIIGYSPQFLLAETIAIAFVFVIPIFLGLKRLPPSSVPVGTYSPAIAAASRVISGTEHQFHCKTDSRLSKVREEHRARSDSTVEARALEHSHEPPLTAKDTVHDSVAPLLTIEGKDFHGNDRGLTNLGVWDPDEILSIYHDHGNHYIQINTEHQELSYSPESGETFYAATRPDVSSDRSSIRRNPCEEQVKVDDEPVTEREYIARNNVKWGTLQMPPEWYKDHDYEPLGFSIMVQEVGAPVAGRSYL
ncbi:hypothetical protein F5Y16DRAFT_140581 [Xylariaceae sp. FL0255]|nr:hypothetical protein F5Y16DRAFT_140581 [Xylariaceae sp. FL0255]